MAQQRLNIFSWHSIAHLCTESFITESFVTESFHHRKLRHRKFRHRKWAYSRPGLRNNRCLHTLLIPFAPFCFCSSPPCLIIWSFPPIPWFSQKAIMVLQGSQAQFHSAKQIANSWILHSAAAAACAKQKKEIHLTLHNRFPPAVSFLNLRWPSQ